MRQVSVIIPSYNSSATITRTVASVTEPGAQAFLKEVLVIDSSDDGRTPEALKGLAREKLRVVRLPVKTIPATARNLGAKEASGELLAFLDSDAYADPDWLEKIVAANERGCRVGGGVILLPPEQRDSPLALAQYFMQFTEFMDGPPRKVRFTPSCNLFCEKGLFEEVGGFPDIRAAEDVLFGLRLVGREPFYFEPAIRVRHIFLETWARYRSNQILLGGYTLEYRRRSSKSWLYRGPTPLLFLPFFLAGKFLKIAGRVCRAQDKALGLKFLLNLPFFMAGMLFLGWGFAKVCFKSEK